MAELDIQKLVIDYLKAFSDRNLDACLAYFDPEATIEWMMGSYTGLDSIRDWHEDRFGAELKVESVDAVNVDGSTVTLDVVVNSKRLAAWRIPSLGGRVTVEMDGGKIQRSKFAVKSINPQQNWA